jgi:uncharacterized spore protein YtfJ
MVDMDIQELLRSVVNQAGAKTVYGDPISADGKTIVPVAKVRYGFGGGSGRKAGEQGQEGGGGGGGFVAHPVGYIEFTSSGTRYVPIVDLESVAWAVVAGACLGLVIGKIFNR